MSEFFLGLVNMSISASWIVLAVLLLRLMLKRAPKWITVLLWGIVALRLICPFTLESVLSLIPSAETINPQIMTENIPVINSGIPIINNAVNPVIGESLSPAPGDSANPLQIWIPILTAVWLVGVAILLTYTAVSYFRVRRRIGTAVLLRDNIYQSERVISPFVLGVVNPKIYLPFFINEQDAAYVIAHEQAHIRRRDYIWKPLGFLLLTLHWFNPLMWLGYVLLCRDIELACDEKVIKTLDRDARADYSQALLDCSVNRRMIAACPLAFGEVNVKGRVKSVLNYKKPAFWLILAAIVACIAVAVCFLTDPPTSEDSPTTAPTAPTVPTGPHQAAQSVISHYPLHLVGQSYTEFDGVYIQFNSIQTTDSGSILFDATLCNKSGTDITYGAVYTIEYKDGDSWVSAQEGGLDFLTVAYVLKSGQKHNQTYSTQGFDMTRSNTFRLIVPFTVNENGESKTYRTWIEFQLSNAAPLEALKASYPEFFGLNTDSGLTVYVWQMSENGYSCHLASGSPSDSSSLEFTLDPSASIGEMRMILSTYNISRDQIRLEPITCFASSYTYTIDDAYRRNLEELFWSTVPQQDPLSAYKTASFDIDGDGQLESCVLRYTPTTGAVNFVLSVRDSERPNQLYRGVFLSEKPADFSMVYDVSFETGEDGITRIRTTTQCDTPESHLYDISIEDGKVVLSEVEKPENISRLDSAIANVLSKKYYSDRPDGCIHAQSYSLLASETVSGTPLAGSSGHTVKTTVYLLVYHAKYTVSSEPHRVGEGDFVPTAITFTFGENGIYTCDAYWTPQESSNYEEDVRNHFPADAAIEALSTEKYAEDLMAESKRQAEEYLNKILNPS